MPDVPETPRAPSIMDGLKEPAAPPVPLAQPKPPVTMRDFGDHDAARAAIFDRTLAAARSLKPVSNSRYSLGIENVDYEDPDEHSLAKQKDAILKGGTLYRRLRGDWVLKDLEGKELDRRRLTLAQIPWLTQQGAFILNGRKYGLGNQLRLRAGVFARLKESGELESHANALPGRGVTHRYSLEPETGVFRMHFAQASMPLISVLKALGKTDTELREAWGNELYAANAKKDDPRSIDRLYQRLVRKANPDATDADKVAAVRQALEKTEFDPEVNRRNLGGDHGRLNADTMMATVQKLLAVSRGQADPDDRDHPANQQLMGPEDLIAERMERPGSILHQLLWKASTNGDLKRLPVNAFDRHVKAAILDSGVGQYLTEINPLEVLDQSFKITRMGVGAMQSMDAVPSEARSVQPAQVGYIDPVFSPESFRAGVDARVAYAAKKGSDGRLYAPYTDPKSGQTVYKSPQDVADLTLAFPGEPAEDRYIRALSKGRLRYVDRNSVDLVLPHAEQWFGSTSNLIFAKNASKGQRDSMGARFLLQSLPLQKAEAPLVRTQVYGQPGKSFEELYGSRAGAVHAEQGGHVVAVSPDAVKVKYADGTVKTHELYQHLPMNQKTSLHSTPLVRPGDMVRPGQILAKSNFTDDNGHVAVGLNARVAFMPFRGLNHLDAWVISRSFADKLTSEHLYQHSLDIDDATKLGKKQYVAMFAAKFGRNILNNIDDNGIVKPGTVVKPGDPLILAASTKPPTHKSVHAGHKSSFADKSLLWDHHDDGVVTDIAQTPKGIVVNVKSLQRMNIGDKLAGRHGNKGIVAKIVDDDEMPHDSEGRPFEVLANPTGVISRTNASQKAELWLGKIAAKRGKPYILEDFAPHDLMDFVEKELAQNGMRGTEDIHDPSTGRKVHVATGVQHYMKLHHQAESKSQGRGIGGYTSEDTPARGGAAGSKRNALMDVNALLSAGATEVLRDARLIRGQKNSEYWPTFMAGYKPATPKVPLVYRKFHEQLRAAGINVQREGSKLHLFAMTNKDIDKLTENRELKSVETVNWKDGMKPIQGGLFSHDLTGSHGGNKWSHFPLVEPMPSPVFEDPIRRMLGLPGKQFEDVLFGKAKLDGKTGPTAIHDALAAIDVKKAIATARADIKGSRKGKRDEAIRKLGYLKALEKQGIEPKDWMLGKVPVLPPIFRPVSQMQTGQQLVADANLLYKEVWDANENLKALRDRVEDTSEERQTLYHAFKALTGLGDPVQPKNRERRVSGFLAGIFGTSPKHSVIQQKLLGTPVDLVGRAVIVPNPDLSIDEAGIPEGRAWEVYSPFIVRRLVRQGVHHVQALEAVDKRSPLARKAMLAEMDSRPVIISRAPVLHRYGRMAFFPRLVKGDSLQVSPLVAKGAGADYDGDTSNYEVPASDEAAAEALHKMLPSRNLVAVSDFKKPVPVPQEDYVGGIHAATHASNTGKRPRTFATRAAALQAWHRGELHPGDPVEILEE